MPGPFLLDGKEVPLITAYLFHAGGHENPATLKANANKSFQGNIVLGMGFTFDDTDKDGVANPIAQMHELITRDKRNAERIFPYIGGEEVNDNPRQQHHRFVIDFFDMPLERAACWPDLLAIVRERVKPERDSQKRDAIREKWWHYAEKRPGLRRSISGLGRVLVAPRTSKHLSFCFLSNGMIYSENLIVFATDSYSFFAVLQSRLHEAWVNFNSSTLEDRQGYRPTDCFETFPFPEGFEKHPRLDTAGKLYYEFRATLMVQNHEGLTKTYNRFHDPNERSPDILKLRELHSVMDRAVLDAYGWTDLKPTCEFLLDYEEEGDEEGGGRQRKKPWRYRWPDDFRDEVLARLLELNKQRAEHERLSGAATAKGKKASKTRHKRSDPTLPGLS
jgi:hypothetical protein